MIFDWLSDFEKNFGLDKDVKDIKKNKFHGALEINFCDGEPKNINIKRHVRAFAIQPRQGEYNAGRKG